MGFYGNATYYLPNGTAKYIEDNAVTSNAINNEAVTADKIANGAVTSDKIDADAITREKIKNGEIIGDKISNDAITKDKIQDGEVVGDKIADNAITKDKIQDGAITRDKVAEEAIGYEEIEKSNIYGRAKSVEGTSLFPQHIVQGSISGGVNGDIAQETITGDNILDDTIEGKHIKEETVEGRHIKSGTIQNVHLESKYINCEYIGVIPSQQSLYSALSMRHSEYCKLIFSPVGALGEILDLDNSQGEYCATNNIIGDSNQNIEYSWVISNGQRYWSYTYTTGGPGSLNRLLNTSNDVLDDSITTNKIIDKAVTPDKLDRKYHETYLLESNNYPTLQSLAEEIYPKFLQSGSEAICFHSSQPTMIKGIPISISEGEYYKITYDGAKPRSQANSTIWTIESKSEYQKKYQFTISYDSERNIISTGNSPTSLLNWEMKKTSNNVLSAESLYSGLNLQNQMTVVKIGKTDNNNDWNSIVVEGKTQTTPSEGQYLLVGVKNDSIIYLIGLNVKKQYSITYIDDSQYYTVEVI